MNSRVILKYSLLHLAELAVLVLALILLRRFIGFPIWITITTLAIWIIKDIVLFPKVWRAYAYDDNNPMKQFIGLEAIVIDDLDPAGYVRVRGELWKAELKNPLSVTKRGDRARVVDIKGMTLIVERCNERRRS